jgi:hypothetical protein
MCFMCVRVCNYVYFVSSLYLFYWNAIFFQVSICQILWCCPLRCYYPSIISIKENLQALYKFRQLRFDNPRRWAASYKWCSIGSYKSTSSIGSLKLRTVFLIAPNYTNLYGLMYNWFRCKYLYLTASFLSFCLTVARGPYKGVMHKALYIHSCSVGGQPYTI